MTEQQLRKFREYYFPEKTITKSRSLMCDQFGLTERTARCWESGQSPIRPWFVKTSKDFDKDGILKV